MRQQITNDCQEALSFLGLYELIPTRVEYYNIITHSIEEIDLVDSEDQVELQKESFESIDGSKLDDIHMLLYVKEKLQISDEAWQELSIRSGKLPSKCSLKQRVRELNKLWNIFETPCDQLGIQMSLKESLTGQISRVQKGNALKNTDTLKIKISGDGTRIGKFLQLLNMPYTIINEGAVAASLRGSHILAIVKAKDDYANIRDSLIGLREEMKNLSGISVNGTNYKIEYFIGGDWKFLATVCGIGPANHNSACIWCNCPKLQWWDTSKTWVIERNVPNIKENSKTRNFYCQRLPLLDYRNAPRGH